MFVFDRRRYKMSVMVKRRYLDVSDGERIWITVLGGKIKKTWTL